MEFFTYTTLEVAPNQFDYIVSVPTSAKFLKHPMNIHRPYIHGIGSTQSATSMVGIESTTHIYFNDEFDDDFYEWTWEPPAFSEYIIDQDEEDEVDDWANIGLEDEVEDNQVDQEDEEVEDNQVDQYQEDEEVEDNQVEDEEDDNYIEHAIHSTNAHVVFNDWDW